MSILSESELCAVSYEDHDGAYRKYEYGCRYARLEVSAPADRVTVLWRKQRFRQRLAEAPIGVALPPMSVPRDSDHASTERYAGSRVPLAAASPLMTGTIVAANGMLSTMELAIAESHTMMIITNITLPPLIISMKFATSSSTLVCSRPPTTTNSPMKNSRSCSRPSL